MQRLEACPTIIEDRINTDQSLPYNLVVDLEKFGQHLISRGMTPDQVSQQRVKLIPKIPAYLMLYIPNIKLFVITSRYFWDCANSKNRSLGGANELLNEYLIHESVHCVDYAKRKPMYLASSISTRFGLAATTIGGLIKEGSSAVSSINQHDLGGTFKWVGLAAATVPALWYLSEYANPNEVRARILARHFMKKNPETSILQIQPREPQFNVIIKADD